LSAIKQILILFLCSAYTIVSAQAIEKKCPKKAGIYSAVVPGAGQFYTKKYWKIPIIYAGLITSAYYIKESNNYYELYKNTYLNRLDGNNSDEFYGQYSNSELITLINHYRRNREISILCFFGTYILNIVDASVSAHLFDYDISNDLSLRIQPIYFSKENATGLSLSFNL
jgi:hypothetical protein